MSENKSGGYIYKFTNLIDGKVYIGQTRAKNPRRRILRHYKPLGYKSYLHSAIKKYGKDNVIPEILFYAFTFDDLNIMEKYFIQYYNSLVPNGYNIKDGGHSGGTLNETARKKLSKSLKTGYKNGRIPSFKGKKFTKEHCDNLSKVRKGFTSHKRRKAQEKAVEKLKIPIYAINLTTLEIFLFDSIASCGKELKLNGACISRTLKRVGNRRQHKGWDFKYA